MSIRSQSRSSIRLALRAMRFSVNHPAAIQRTIASAPPSHSSGSNSGIRETRPASEREPDAVSGSTTLVSLTSAGTDAAARGDAITTGELITALEGAPCDATLVPLADAGRSATRHDGVAIIP